jgi:hypothetical protein
MPSIYHPELLDRQALDMIVENLEPFKSNSGLPIQKDQIPSSGFPIELLLEYSLRQLDHDEANS